MTGIGILAMIASLTIVVLGLPAQIIKNHRDPKNCEGIDYRLVLSVGIAYLFWSLYGWTKPDWFLIISQTPGCVLSSILIFQMIRYRTRR
ncbi:MAG: hypothetical protein A3A13_01715 [Candidatus Yanofskybacteria bacterium RIFCSPLOWO2_01_FULL_43_22]|uniref:MtN3 and saliva related transmembrane protein n=1 Tax=Candidatus Yanofskybacteria bacterium RIFCSPLOWO2_01_FULL_43_22 TaxID=1802695 RepID=A0A1F8GED9_9BACT|nr:MAG: hypothetical protein A3A13_01715 [Candidatus Yanofskybacteria bacterium RIFCSPLOWO2_01_FULL_43_22]